MSDPQLSELKALIRNNLDTLERPKRGADRRRADRKLLHLSQFFENTLEPDRWHTDLLEKMTLHIEGVRLPAVSQANYPNLLELPKFRHLASTPRGQAGPAAILVSGGRFQAAEPSLAALTPIEAGESLSG